MGKKAYMESGMTLEDRLGRNAHYRGKDIRKDD
jgi:hypothetical protein